MSENKPNIPSTWVDPDDAPELDARFFREADLYQGDQLVRRGRGRPKLASRKILLSVRYSPEVVTYFRETGEGWQSRMDVVLREYVRRKASAKRAVQAFVATHKENPQAEA